MTLASPVDEFEGQSFVILRLKKDMGRRSRSKAGGQRFEVSGVVAFENGYGFIDQNGVEGRENLGCELRNGTMKGPASETGFKNDEHFRISEKKG